MIGQNGVPTLVRILVTVQTDRAALRADRAGTDDHLVYSIEQEIAIDEPDVERVRLEGHDRLHGVVLRAVQRVPAEIGADVDKNSGRRRREVAGNPLRQQRLMGAVFGNMAPDAIAVMGVEG